MLEKKELSLHLKQLLYRRKQYEKDEISGSSSIYATGFG